MPPSMVDSIPAQLILSAEDVLHYISWQEKHYPKDTPGRIRHAIQYHQFIQHRFRKEDANKQDSTKSNNAHVAAECGHELHPSDNMTAGYCPICEVQMSLRFLDVIAKAFRDAGGPWHTNGPAQKKYVTLRQGWHMARLQLQGAIDLLWVSATYEAQWEAEHPDKVVAARKANTSAKALRLAEMEHKYPAMISKYSASGPERTPSKLDTSEPKPEKKVAFVSGTNFGPSRHCAEYHRGSHLYEPGDHACKPGREWLNVSRFGSIPADICNLKLFVTTSQADFDELNEDASLRPGQCQGLIGSHSGAQVISDFLQNFQEQREGGLEELKEMVHYSDAMIVLVDGDKVLDVYLSHSDDIEDEDYEDDEVDQSRWTCLREVLLSIPSGSSKPTPR